MVVCSSLNICSLYNDAVSNADCIGPNDWTMVNNELKKTFGMMRSWQTFVWGTREKPRNLSVLTVVVPVRFEPGTFRIHARWFIILRSLMVEK
jgi:hypothetical protein